MGLHDTSNGSDDCAFPIDPVLDAREALQDPTHGVAHLRDGEILADADTWSSIERNVCPDARLPFLPAPGGELLWWWEVRARGRVDVARQLHVVRAVYAARVLGDADGSVAIRSAAAGEGGVAECEAQVERHDWIKTESFGNGVRKQLHAFEVGVRGHVGLVPDSREDLRAEVSDKLRLAAEFAEEPAERTRGGVAASQKNGDELIAKNGTVARVGCDGV